MKDLLALYLIDYNGLTRRERLRLGWYAAIILASYYDPSLNQIMGW